MPLIEIDETVMPSNISKIPSAIAINPAPIIKKPVAKSENARITAAIPTPMPAILSTMPATNTQTITAKIPAISDANPEIKKTRKRH